MLKEAAREARILSKTYHDRMDVYRTRYTKDPKSGESVKTECLLYHDRRCALSVSDNGAPEEHEIVSRNSNQYVIFAAPDIQMIEGDRVVVRQESGQVYEGRCGRTFVYRSHGETELKVEKVS